MHTDRLKDLPRLGADAMGPCIGCRRQLLETGIPIFYRIEAKLCGLDAPEIRRHVGLAQAMGGGEAGLALATVLGPGVKPVIVMEAIKTFNVCHECATNGAGLLDVIGMQWEKDREEEGLPVPDRDIGDD